MKTLKAMVIIVLLILSLGSVYSHVTGDAEDEGSDIGFIDEEHDHETFDEFEDFDEFEGEFKREGEFRKEFKEEGRHREDEFEFRERRRFEPDFGPSYEGYDKKHMLFGKVFIHVEDELEPDDIMQYCDEPNKIADIVISKVKEKIGDVSNVCNEFEEEEKFCKEESKKHCEFIGRPEPESARDELEKLEFKASSCPPDLGAMEELCIYHSRQYSEDRMEFIDEQCEDQWEFYGKQEQEYCKQMKRDNICNKDEFIDDCIDRWGVRKDDFEHRDDYPKPEPMPYPQPMPINDKPAEVCPDVYEPVCGDNGVTYRNKCDAERAGISFKIGECVHCAFTPEEAKRMENECLNNNGVPERIYEKDCIVDVRCAIKTEQTITDATGKTILVTGYDVLETHDDYVRECEREWENQKRMCNEMPRDCSKDSYVDECTAREKENYERDLKMMGRQCEREAKIQSRHMERQCSRMEMEKKRCYEESERRCSMMAGLIEECRSTLTEENLREFVVNEAKKRCKFMRYEKDGDFSKYDRMEVIVAVLNTISDEEVDELRSIIKDLRKGLELEDTWIFKGFINPRDFGELKKWSYVVNAKLSPPESSDRAKEVKRRIVEARPERVVEKLLELRDSEVPSEYRYLVEEEADRLLDVSDSLEEIDEKEGSKGFFYKMKLFLGFAKKAEEDDVKKLELSRQRLETSIKALSSLSDEVPDDIAKAILKEQAKDLERQKEDIDDLIEQKQKRAKGLFSLFG